MMRTTTGSRGPLNQSTITSIRDPPGLQGSRKAGRQAADQPKPTIWTVIACQRWLKSWKIKRCTKKHVYIWVHTVGYCTYVIYLYLLCILCIRKHLMMKIRGPENQKANDLPRHCSAQIQPPEIVSCSAVDLNFCTLLVSGWFKSQMAQISHVFPLFLNKIPIINIQNITKKTDPSC